MTELMDSQTKATKNDNQSGTMPLVDIFFMTLRHWPWIILSIFVCVSAAYFYLLRTPNVYTRTAEILIKDDKKGKSASGEDFANLGLFQSNSNIPNEIANISSKDLMEEVVKRLNLDINYYHDGRFHDVVLYGYDLPVKLSVVDYPDEQSFSLNLSVSPKGDVTISNLAEPNKTYSDKFTGKLNDSINTPIGKIVVSPSSYYQKDEDISIIVNKIPLNSAIASYRGRLNVAQSNDKSTIIRLTISDQSTQRADEVLNTVIGVYNENWIRDRNQLAVSTSNFINDRLAVIENELGNVDSDISSYKSANLIPDVEAAASMYMSQNQQTQAQILEVNNQLSMARYIKSYLTSDNNHDQLLPANTGLQSSNIQSLISEYNDNLLQRNSLVAKSSEKNPLVTQLDEKLNAQRMAVIRTIDNEILALNTQLKSLRGSEAQTLSRLASNPTQAKTLLSTERQQKVKESLYLYLLQKREENELTQAFTAYNTRIINKPGASGTPVSPNRSSILAMAFLLGLIFPFGVTFLKEMSNTKLRGRNDLKHLAIPFLGEIPSNSAAKKDNKSVCDVQPGKRDIINEAFRVLRTNVEFLFNASEGSHVVAITSFNPGSGKSYITVNLGMSIAIKDKKVILVDGDMRHGSTSAYVNSPSKGLSDYLSGSDDDLSSLIVQDQTCPNLYILPVGSIPPNPTELLESKRFATLIQKLKSEFEYVILDCPPIEVVADAQIIDQYADRTFFIVRAGLLERSMLPELDQLYETKKYKNMAVILNYTRNEKGRYGYSHSYRYGYGYGYGYGYNYGTSKSKKGSVKNVFNLKNISKK